jgi:type IV fimbrial biogenesis protein FimT
MRMRKTVTPYGFTLVELMVTVAVAAILLILAVPSFADFIDKSRLRGASDSVVDFINKARAQSVKQGRDVNVAFDGTSTAWCVGANVAAEPANPGEPIPAVEPCACGTTPAACVVEGQQSTLDSSTLNGVTIDAIPDDFTFDSRLGTINPLGTTVATLTSPRKKFELKLTVSPIGQVSLCVPATSKRAFSEFPSC